MDKTNPTLPVPEQPCPFCGEKKNLRIYVARPYAWLPYTAEIHCRCGCSLLINTNKNNYEKAYKLIVGRWDTRLQPINDSLPNNLLKKESPYEV